MSENKIISDGPFYEKQKIIIMIMNNDHINKNYNGEPTKQMKNVCTVRNGDYCSELKQKINKTWRYRNDKKKIKLACIFYFH